MADFSATNYNSNNINNTLYAYQSNRVVSPNNKVQTTTTVPLETPPDTFELSGKNKIHNNKEKGMSDTMKWLLGIGGIAATIGAFVIGHKTLTKKPSLETIQQNFSTIFRKDISTEETKNLAKRYKEIFEIKDSEEFTRTLFSQVKKDYGYEKANLPLEINYMTGKETLSECLRRRAGGFSSQYCNMVIDLPIIKGGNLSNSYRKDLLDTLYHEFRHMQQTELCYRSNASKYLEALEQNSKKCAGNIDKEIESIKAILNSKSELTKYANRTNQSVEKTKEGLEVMLKSLEKRDELALILAGGNSFDKKRVATELERCFKDVPLRENINEFKTDIDKFMENSANYLKGEEVGMKAYKAQPLETDAHSVGNMARKIYDYIFMKG